MPLVFVPTSDYATTATQAATVQEIDLGCVMAGSSASRSFRIGNRSAAPVTVTLYVDADEYLPPDAVSLSVQSVTIPADGFSDTLTATVQTPLEANTSPLAASVVALAGDGSTASLELNWTAVGANSDRTSQYPEYATGYTDNVTAAILRAAEPLRLYRFDPLPYPEAPDEHFISWRETPQGGREITSWQNPAARMDPHNPEYGYTASVQTIRASFQSEEWTIDQQFTRDDTTVTYTGTARLIIPAEYELTRQWALFEPARGADRSRWKRSVYLCQRRGQVWVMQDVVPVYRGPELAYWRCNLIPLSDATIGAPAYYSPFGLTYEYNNDRPYAYFPYRVDDIRPLLHELDGTA